MPKNIISGSRQDWQVIRGLINDNFSAIDFVNVSEFGAVGDGITDDATALQEALNFARDNNKNIVFQQNKVYASSALDLEFYGGMLEGNGSSIKMTDDSATPTTGITYSGTIGTFYNSDANIIANDQYVSISNTTFLNSLSIGDMVFIKSDALYRNSTDAVQGESNIIVEIESNRVRLASLLHDTYLTSNNAKIARVESKPVVIKNLTIDQNPDKTASLFLYGITISNCKNLLIDNCVVNNAKQTAITVENNYAPVVRNCKSYISDREGGGYGVEIVGNVVNYVVDGCVNTGTRHAIAHNRSITQGVPHNGLIINCIGENVVNSHVFDTHGETDKVRFENCIAIGGIDVAQESDYKGEWNILTTYNSGETVSKDNILWDCDVTTSTGDDPTSSDNWSYHNNSASGFATRSDDIEIINCKVFNCSVGISGEGYIGTKRNFIVNGLECYNVADAAISITGVTSLINYKFDNVGVYNKYYKSEPYILKIDGATITNGYFGKLIGTNIRGLSITDLDDRIEIDELKCMHVPILQQNDCNNAEIFIDKLNIVGINSGEYNVNLKNLSSFEIGSLVADNCNNSVVYIDGDITNFKVGNVSISGSTEFDRFMLLITANTITNLSIGISNITASTAIKFIKNQGTITNSYLQYISGDYTEDYDSGFTVPTNQYIGYLLKP